MEDHPKKKAEWTFQVESSFVREKSLSTEARLLYLVIKSFASPDSPIPFPSLPTLARHMGKHRVSIQKYVNELETSGWLTKIQFKDKGKFGPTRYDLKTRSQHSSLRTQPTTANLATKKNQFKEVPSTERESKESEGSPPNGSAGFSLDPSKEEEYEATWKPIKRGAKDTQLRNVKMPLDYPSEEEFEGFLDSEDLYVVASSRGDLYRELCLQKWHQWHSDQGADGRWRPIRDWRRYIQGLDQTIRRAMEAR